MAMDDSGTHPQAVEFALMKERLRVLTNRVDTAERHLDEAAGPLASLLQTVAECKERLEAMAGKDSPFARASDVAPIVRAFWALLALVGTALVTGILLLLLRKP